MQRFLKIGFGVLALAAITFGGMRIAQQIKLTFSEDGTNKNKESNEVLDEVRQKVIDTDKDGLTDWDESRVYNTSPYLKDSDSDGIDDAEEIKNNTDPNCPKGRDCGSKLQEVPQAASTAPAASVNETLPSSETDASLPENLSPEEIRVLLKQGGVSDEELKDASDEALLQLYEEVKNQQ